MSGRTDTVKSARVRFWVALAFAGFLLGIGYTDMGGEAVGFGLMLLWVGAQMENCVQRIKAAMDAEERG